MTLPYLILIPMAGGLLAWFSDRIHSSLPRWISLFSMALPLVMLVSFRRGISSPMMLMQGRWLSEMRYPWIPQWGIGIHLGIDGISLVLLLLTYSLGIVAVLGSWTEIRERTGLFHISLMAAVSGIAGVFLSLDLFLFAFSWELMLVPMYFLILLWGHENRRYAALKFFIFTQAGGMLMLVSIVGLVVARGTATGVYTFDYAELLGTTLEPGTAFWLMLGFLAAFAVKVPALPFHTWLADAHTEAPTAGSVVLAGLLLKTGAYGLIRFAIPLFPSAAESLSVPMMAVGAAGIIYGGFMAFGQTDFKRLVAYTSVGHMGFVLMGIFAWNTIALQGAVMQMICHGISTGALFVIAGALQERFQTRDMSEMGGLWATLPRISALALFFGLASLGLPGLGNFVGEFLVLLGSFRVSMPVVAVSAGGLVIAAIYALWMIQGVFHGPAGEKGGVRDLDPRETIVLGVMAIALLWLGLFPQRALDTSGHGVERTLRKMEGAMIAAGTPMSDGKRYESR